ncbi:hypothetical protein BKA62DRAFT_742232 [Auriculariales sp. MPI-PUGE-AT-0066]|nr:hypothetical protein BKA62DRAFT_742232 [Auriculariales sp. MPI-PUGE-AT-0066]
MESQVGVKCAVCSLVDFLPILCAACGQELCKDHIHNHQCLTATQPAPHEPSQKLARCALESCDKPSLDSLSTATSVLCDGCKLAFCAYHREPSSHNCVPIQQEREEPKNAEARALLERYFRDIPKQSGSSAQSTVARTPKPPTDPTKLARYEALELMKLRHRAKPADPKDLNVPQPDRVHVRVNQIGRPAADNKLLWFKKVCIPTPERGDLVAHYSTQSISTGRAVDLCAALFNLNRSAPLALFAVTSSADSQTLDRLPNDKALADLVFDGTNLILASPDTNISTATTAASSSS